jgi:hypothetical protein
MGLEANSTVLQRVVGIIVAVLVVVWIISNPAVAGNTFHHWFSDIATFFHHLL